MYLPDLFEETDPAAVRAVVETFPLAAIVAMTPDGLIANHIPLMFTGEATLAGHVAAANDMHLVVPEGAEILAVFRGEDSYISPNWYPTKPEHHRHVPTWNYQAVHVSGRIRFLRDEKSKRAVVGRLTRLFETATNGDAAWRMADAPRDYMEQMLGMIVAFEIDVTRVLAKSKLSQNREAKDYANVAEKLGQTGRDRLARRMSEIGPKR